jgi:acetate kinase
MKWEAFRESAAVVVFNVGSSSLTFKLYRHSDVLVSGKCHRVGVTGLKCSFIETCQGGTSERHVIDLPNHESAAAHVLALLFERGFRLDAAGHRFADGGDTLSTSVVVNSRTRPVLERCVPLAPLHNAAALSIIDLIEARDPGIPQYVVFDSTFHAGLLDVARAYALPAELATRYRKHGFHGLSYADVTEKAIWYLGEEHFKAVALHLGTGGSSACAIADGRSVDTSMGYSPLQGLVMNTRCGDLDPGILLDLVRQGYGADQLIHMLHRESGLLGLSGGVTSDIRDLIKLRESDPRAKLAFDLYAYRARQYVGAYSASMNGLDLLIFTDDVGLRVPEVRTAICVGLGYLGVNLDEDRNRTAEPDRIEPLHAEGAGVRILAIPTDEEAVIYDEGLRLMGGPQPKD